MQSNISVRSVNAWSVFGNRALGLALVLFFLPLASCLVHNDPGFSRPTLGTNAAAPAAKLSLPRASKVQVRIHEFITLLSKKHTNEDILTASRRSSTYVHPEMRHHPENLKDFS